jgi:hypothetical protein
MRNRPNGSILGPDVASGPRLARQERATINPTQETCHSPVEWDRIFVPGSESGFSPDRASGGRTLKNER